MFVVIFLKIASPKMAIFEKNSKNDNLGLK